MNTSLIRLTFHGGMIVIEHEMKHATQTDKRCYEKEANSPCLIPTAHEQCLVVPAHGHKALFTFVFQKGVDYLRGALRIFADRG